MLIKVRPMHILALTALTALTACGQGKFLGGLYGGKDGGESLQGRSDPDGQVEAVSDSSLASGTSESKKPIEANQSVGQDGATPPAKGSDAGPEQKINEPVMVGGAFLVCANDAKIPHTPAQNGIGCRFEDINSKPLAMSDNVQAAFTIIDVLNFKIETAITRSPAGSPWLWTMAIPTIRAPGARVQLDLLYVPTKEARTTTTAITGVGASTTGAYTTTEYLFLGDSDLSKPDRSVNTKGCDTVPGAATHARSRRITIPFRVLSANEKVAVNLIGVDGVNAFGNDNYARVVVAGGSIVNTERISRTWTSDANLSGFTSGAANSNYNLVIESGELNGDLDDFCIQKIEIKSNSQIVISPPAFNN